VEELTSAKQPMVLIGLQLTHEQTRARHYNWAKAELLTLSRLPLITLQLGGAEVPVPGISSVIIGSTVGKSKGSLY
jgi:hypothetical protein